MKVFVAVIVLTFLGKSAPQTLTQSQLSITRSQTKSVRFLCQVENIYFDDVYIHWYRQRQGEELQRLLYFKDQSEVQKDVSDTRLFVEKEPERKSCTLILKDIREDDTGTYYCAYWATTGAWKKIFGSGTRLIVTGTEVKAPTLRLFPPQIVDAEGFLVCLVTGFFPEVIKVQWKIAGDEKADTSTNTFTDSVKEMHGKTYSLISRFKISKLDWEAKTFTCHVQHEGGSREASISRQSRLAASKTDVVTGPPCPPSVQESLEITDEGTSSSSLKVATLTYTLLLMKSVLYCGIISFILYKVEYRGTQKPL